MQINDGTGGGYVAKVSATNRIAVDADDGVIAGARAGTVYVITNTSGHPTLTMTSAGGIMVALLNSENSKKSFVIDSILVASGAVGTNVSVEINYTVGSTGNTEDVTGASSTNTAYPSGSSATATGYIWDEGNDGITGLTQGTGITRTILAAGGPTELVPSGRVIIAPGGNIGVLMKPSTGTPEISFAIRFYEIDEHKGY